jgi:hypothetical protein
MTVIEQKGELVGLHASLGGLIVLKKGGHRGGWPTLSLIDQASYATVVEGLLLTDVEGEAACLSVCASYMPRLTKTSSGSNLDR